MLIQLVIQNPQIIGPVLKSTPGWVWGLLAALVTLGLTQVRTRKVSALRMALTPVAMTGFSLWGTASAFGSSPLFGYVLFAWAAGAIALLALMGTRQPHPAARYDAATRSFTLPGSWLPLALILGIFSVKYVVGVELVMQPALAHDGLYTLVAGGLYGLFSGAFAGRALRTFRLAFAGMPGSYAAHA